MMADDTSLSATSTSTEPKRSKVCSICHGESETYHLNYGVSTCFSCRAFFRRAIQKTRQPSFVCKKAGQCVITPKTRRQCQRCRYENCIRAGMKPECVLNSDEKCVRFRKMIKKEQKLKLAGNNGKHVDSSSSSSSSSVGGSGSNEASEGKTLSYNRKKGRPSMESLLETSKTTKETGPCQTKKLQKVPGLQKACDMTVDENVKSAMEAKSSGNGQPSDFKEESGDSENEGQMAKSVRNVQATTHGYNVKQFNFMLPVTDNASLVSGEETSSAEDLKTSVYVAQLQESWHLACKKVRTDRFEQALLAFHQGRGSLGLGLVHTHLNTIRQLFREFARLQPDFGSLSGRDQSILAHGNACLFAQCLLGLYIGAPSGRMQVNWLTFADPTARECEADAPLNQVMLGTFNEVTGLFRHDAPLECYGQFCHRLAQNNLGLNSLCFVALTCLFHTKHLAVASLDEPARVAACRQTLLDAVDWSAHRYCCPVNRQNLADVLATLEVMALFFDHQSNATTSEHTEIEEAVPVTSQSHELPMPYTTEEELWIQRQLEDFDTAFSRITMHTGFTHEFVMNHFDVPVSKSFVPQAISVFNARFLNVLRHCDEFTSQLDAVQFRMWQSKLYGATALSAAFIDACPTGSHQLDLILTPQERAAFRCEYPMMQQVQMKKATLGNINQYLGIFSKDQLNRFLLLMRNLQSMVSQPEQFKLLSMAHLCSPSEHAGADGQSSMAKLSARYLTLLRRRLQYLAKNDQEARRGQMVLSRSLSDVREMSGFMQLMGRVAKDMQ